MRATTAEIHAYPTRPEGYFEPLFPTAQSRRQIAMHLLEAPWLARASELPGRGGGAARAREEPIDLRRRGGCVEVMRSRSKPGSCSWRRCRVVGVIDRWREVGSWWSEDDAVDRRGFRVAVAGCRFGPGRAPGAVVDLVLDRNRGWVLSGVVD